MTPAVRNLIREAKTFQIQSMMQVGKAVGMVTLNDALMDLVTKKLVVPEEAYAKAIDKPAFEASCPKRPGPPLQPLPPRLRLPTLRRLTIYRLRIHRAIFVRFCRG